MGVDKLKRVMWLLAERHPEGVYRRKEVEKVIMTICGIHPQTIRYTFAALLKLGWLKHWHYRYKNTGLIDTEDFEL